MKKVKRFLASMAILVCAMSITPSPIKAAPPVSVSFQFFYDNLSPYGSWVSYPSYGYVWVPRAAGFRPYCSGGHWVFTDEGWMWVSNYDWGWAPFHYGSWFYDSYYGWLWVPGYDWAPAWVTWGYYSGYYGWAPSGPGISFSVGYYPPINYWVFAPPRYVTVDGFNNNYYVANDNRIVINNNTFISNVNNINVVNNTGTYEGRRFSAGPAQADFEKTASTKLNAVSVREHNQPGKAGLSGNAISVYRPRVDASDRKSAKPAKVVPLEQVKRSEGSKAAAPDKMKNREADRKAAPEQKAKERTPERKVAPEQKPNIKERQPERQQPKMQERKPQMKEQPKREERKQEVQQPKQNERPQRDVQQPQEKPKQEIQRQPEQRKEAVPSQQERPMQREARPNMERRSSQPQQRQQQPQQREQHENHNPK